jgi:hypothetical protein
MSTLSPAARNAARNAINALADAGSGSNPTLRFQTSGDVDLLVVNLDSTKAIADAVDGVSTYNNPDGEDSWVNYEQTPSASGTCAKAVLADKDGNVVETASVGTTGSGEEIELTSLSLTTEIPVEFLAAPTATQIVSYDPTP